MHSYILRIRQRKATNMSVAQENTVVVTNIMFRGPSCVNIIDMAA